MPSYISEGLYDLGDQRRRRGNFDVVGDSEKDASPIEGGKLFPVDPCSEDVEVDGRGAVTLTESVDIHMDASVWAVRTVAVVPLGGYSGAIKGPENFEKVMEDYVAFQFLLSLVAGAKGVRVCQIKVDIDNMRVEL